MVFKALRAVRPIADVGGSLRMSFDSGSETTLLPNRSATICGADAIAVLSEGEAWRESDAVLAVGGCRDAARGLISLCLYKKR